MKDRESSSAAASVLILLLILFGGYSPQGFAGSAFGGFLAITGTLMLSVSLLYSAVKRIDLVKKIVVRHIRMGTILTWHIHAGFMGTVLVLIHTGHKFNSVLAASLTGLTLAVVFSGVIGRYLQRQIGDDVRDKRKLLNHLYEEYDSVSTRDNLAADYNAQVNPNKAIGSLSVTADTRTDTTSMRAVVSVVELVSSIADVESAITARETLKQWFTIWYRVHLTLAIGMYLLLVFHVWSGIHFGLRWVQ